MEVLIYLVSWFIFAMYGAIARDIYVNHKEQQEESH